MAASIIATQNKEQTQCKLYYIAVAVILRSFIFGQSCNKYHLKFTVEADSLLGNPGIQGNKGEIIINLVFWYLNLDVIFNTSSMFLGLLTTVSTLFLGKVYEPLLFIISQIISDVY